MLFSRPVPIITKLLVSVAICSASVASAPAYASAACQPGTTCVLPVRDAPPPPPPAEPVVEVDEPKSFGILPILAVVAAAALLYFLVIDDDDDEEEPISP